MSDNNVDEKKVSENKQREIDEIVGKLKGEKFKAAACFLYEYTSQHELAKPSKRLAKPMSELMSRVMERRLGSSRLSSVSTIATMRGMLGRATCESSSSSKCMRGAF